PAAAVSVIAPQGPDLIEHDVGAVDLEADRGLADVGPADAEEDVLQGGRVGGAAPPRTALTLSPGGTLGAELQQDRRVDRPGVEGDAGDVDAGHVGDAHRDLAGGR